MLTPFEGHDLPTDLKDGQWELNGVRFGRFTNMPINSVDWGGVEIQAAEYDRPMRDGRIFGQETRQGSTLAFSGGCAGGDPVTDMERLSVAWMNNFVRMRGGATNTLAYSKMGKRRFFYGRPRRFGPMYNGHKSPYTEFAADFQRSTPYSYDVGIERTTMYRGTKTNLNILGSVMPLTVFRIYGPTINPFINIYGPTGTDPMWSIAMQIELVSSEQFIEINPLPGENYVMNQAGYSVAGKITAKSPSMSSMVLPTGTCGVELRDGRVPTAVNNKLDVLYYPTYAGI